MTQNELQIDLKKLLDCDFIRYCLTDSSLDVTVVADNEKEEEHQDDETKDEEEGDDDCCSDMNGHLFKIRFLKPTGVKVLGEESDTYKTLNVKNDNKHIKLEYEGREFTGVGSLYSLEFDYSDYEVIDLGKIEGPDV